MENQAEQEGTAVRQRLLAAALELFTNRGYAATSVREIVEAAGVSKPVLYYYFGSKEGIYLELMKDSYATFESVVSRLVAFRGSVRERIIHFCEGLFDGFVENLSVVRLIYSIYFGTPQGAPYFNLDRYFERMLEVIGGLVREGIENGELKEGDSADIVWTIVACLNVTMEEQLCHTPPRLDRNGMTRMLHLVFNGIAQGVAP